MKDKIIWTFELIEVLPGIPETYLKHIESTDGFLKFEYSRAAMFFAYSVSLTMETW